MLMICPLGGAVDRALLRRSTHYPITTDQQHTELRID